MNPLFRTANDGAIAVCRGCRRVYEGTASFAISHHAQCQHQRVYDALYRHERSTAGPGIEVMYESPSRAEVVFAILGELS